MLHFGSGVRIFSRFLLCGGGAWPCPRSLWRRLIAFFRLRKKTRTRYNWSRRLRSPRSGRTRRPCGLWRPAASKPYSRCGLCSHWRFASMWGSWTRRWMPCKSSHMPIPGWNCRWSSRWYRSSQLWCYSRRLYLPSLRVVPAARPMPVVSSMTMVPAGGNLF